MKRKCLAIGIILLFIVSIVAPMTIGYTTRSTEKYNKYDFDSYHISEIYNNEKQIRRNPVPDTVTSDISVLYNGITSPSSVLGPMDSAWPMFCHDLHHTGRSPYSTANNSGMIQWSFLLHGWGLYGSACINSEGTIYIPTNDDNLYALNPNGTLKWKYKTNGVGFSCPALDKNGTIYFGIAWGYPCYFYAINSDGTLKWSYYTGNEIFSSPAIGSDGTIYFGCGQSIRALFSNGTLRWQHSTGHVVYSSPVIGDDGTVYCGCHDTYLYALYPNNGTLKWQFKTGDWIRTSPCIGDDGTVYCVSLDKYFYAIYPNNGTMKWKTDVYAGTSPTIGPDGTIYEGWDSLHAVNPIDGSIKWSFPASYIEGRTPCTSSDGTIFFGTTGGELIALNPDGTLLWRVYIGGCESAPAIGEDGTIYVGSVDYDDHGHLNAIGAGELKKIDILTPKKGRVNIFGFDLCPGIYGQTFLIGTTPIKLKVYQENELFNVTFKITTQDSHTYYYVDTEPPFEWTMNKRFSEKIRESLTLTVIGYYKGQYTWSESIPVFYFHFLK